MLVTRPGWELLPERFEAFLHCENDTALIAATSVLDRGVPQKARRSEASQEEMRRRAMDAGEIYQRGMERIGNTFFGGDAFPVVGANFGTAGHAKYFRGCRYQFASTTMWYFPSLQYGDLPEYLGENSILSEELSCLRRLGELGKGKFFVPLPDNCGTIDALAHLRGSDALLMDMLDDPEWVRACTRKIMEGYFDSSERIFDAVRENNLGGSCHGWMQVWTPGRVQQLQADFSVMISPQMYERFILPDLEEACDWLDYSIYHFDGQEQIRHLDMLLSIKNLNAIQWTHVAGQPAVTEFIPELRRIQAAGKGLILFPETLSQAKELLENLRPQGLHIITARLGSEAEAREYLMLRK